MSFQPHGKLPWWIKVQLLVLSFLVVIFGESCVEENAKKHAKLNATAFLSLPNVQHEDCLEACYDKETCQSYNMDFWTMTCHLLNISIKTHPKNLIENSTNWVYMSNVEHPCYEEPCLNGGTCRHIKGKGTKCYCPENFLGERCEDGL